MKEEIKKRVTKDSIISLGCTKSNKNNSSNVVDKYNSICYTGEAKIICVYGSGSFGVSTLASSLALKLSNEKRVLVMDMDVISPKLDKYISTSPIIKELTDLGSTLNRSSYGAYSIGGIEYFRHNPKVVIQVKVYEEGCLDYFSGIYTTSFSLNNLDYTSLFDYLGNKYDYIIIDAGKLGFNNSLIENLADIAYKSIVVTQECRADIRSALLKLEGMCIDLNKLIWVIGMSKSMRLESNLKKMLKSIPTIETIPFTLEIYGSNKTLEKSQITNSVLTRIHKLIL